MSLLVPGLGSIYSGHYVDGLYYFFLTAGSGALALNVFDPQATFGEQKAAFYVLGTVALATYVASIFGASLAAQRHNALGRHHFRRLLLDRTPEILPLVDAVRR